MSVLDNILDLGVKYGPEVAQYFSGQKRIRQAIEDQRREQLPEFGRRSATAAEQTLSNLANRDTFAGAKEEARRQELGARTIAGKTKGGMRNLAQLLGAGGRVQQQLADAEVTQRRASAQAAAPFERAIQDYNMQVDDQEKMYGLMKERQINSLEDQAQRMRGRGARTLFDILGDSRGLFAKPPAENPAPDRMEQIDSLPAAQIENPALEKTLLGSPKSLDMSALQKAREYGDNLTAGDELMDLLNVSITPPDDIAFLPSKDGVVMPDEEAEEFGVVDGGVDPLDLAMYVANRDLPGKLKSITESARSFGEKEADRVRKGIAADAAKSKKRFPSNLEGILTDPKYRRGVLEALKDSDATGEFLTRTPNNVPRVNPGTIQGLLKFLTNR